MDALVPLSATRGGTRGVLQLRSSLRLCYEQEVSQSDQEPDHRTQTRTQHRTGPAHSASLRSSALQQVSVAGLRLHVQVV